MRPARRLRSDAAARIAALRGAPKLDDLYRKPVHELTPGELAAMRAAFLRGNPDAA